MALIGTVICMAAAALHAGHVLSTGHVAAMISCCVLGLTGGGPLRLHARGWRLSSTL